MSEEVREQAWQAFCTRLEKLDIDPYSPNLPPDDLRYTQLQAAVSEYEIAIGKVIPVPPGWEGSPPDHSIQKLGGLIEWLQGEWNLILAYEVGGGQDQHHLIELAARTLRNAFRTMDWLGARNRPSRPLPPWTVADAKEHIKILILWLNQQDFELWKPLASFSELLPPPSQTSPVSEGPSGPSVKLTGRGKPPIVLGRVKPVLNDPRYNVVQALLDAGSEGLTKDLLDKRSGHSEARKILKTLANSDPDWASVISFPKTSGVGNGLLPISWSRDNGSQGCGCSSDWVAGELSSIGTYLSNWAAYSAGVW